MTQRSQFNFTDDEKKHLTSFLVLTYAKYTCSV